MSDPWSRYWAREGSGACLPGAPPAVQARLESVWTAAAKAAPVEASWLDVAAGGGAVARIVQMLRSDLKVSGVDAAQVGPDATALGVRGGIDANALPFPDGSFTIVTSQFGLEYCPQAAWAEAVRVLQPRGQLLLICHHQDSPAVAQNGARLAAMVALSEAGLFVLAEAMAARQAEDALRVAKVQAALAAHAGQSVVQELPAALGHWARMARPDAVRAIKDEAEAEMARLKAMQTAALSAGMLAERANWLEGITITTQMLQDGDAASPLAWVIRGVKA
jgi:SAM-dependent methyltransferase